MSLLLTMSMVIYRRWQTQEFSSSSELRQWQQQQMQAQARRQTETRGQGQWQQQRPCKGIVSSEW
jgi:hypothetical protein